MHDLSFRDRLLKSRRKEPKDDELNRHTGKRRWPYWRMDRRRIGGAAISPLSLGAPDV